MTQSQRTSKFERTRNVAETIPFKKVSPLICEAWNGNQIQGWRGTWPAVMDEPAVRDWQISDGDRSRNVVEKVAFEKMYSLNPKVT